MAGIDEDFGAPRRFDENPADSDPLAAVLSALVGTVSVLCFAYLGALGFAGGRIPLAGWALPGGLLPGLAWLLILGSVGLIVLWFVPLMAAMALYSAVDGLRTARVPARRPARRAPLRPRASRQAA